MARSALQVFPIPAYDDNYIWLLSDGEHAVVVDPGDAQPVIATLRQAQLKLTAILITHHHADHVGGIAELLAWIRSQGDTVQVYGPLAEEIPECHQGLVARDSLHFAAPELDISILEVPGHTRGHIAFYLEYQGQSHLFCGDTLFASGCGRLFEGTASQMWQSLDQLRQLPDKTWVHCAHEYTLSNIRFALSIEPHNVDLQQWEARAKALRQVGKPTVPTTIGHEKKVNPFLRCEEDSVMRAVRLGDPQLACDPVSIFAKLRAMKDVFR